jgi:hypothetical protein
MGGGAVMGAVCGLSLVTTLHLLRVACRLRKALHANVQRRTSQRRKEAKCRQSATSIGRASQRLSQLGIIASASVPTAGRISSIAQRFYGLIGDRLG